MAVFILHIDFVIFYVFVNKIRKSEYIKFSFKFVTLGSIDATDKILVYALVHNDIRKIKEVTELKFIHLLHA